MENNLQEEYYNKVMCSPYSYLYVFMNLIHLFLIIGTITYPLFVRERNEFDFYYLIFLYVVMVQWILFKNECLINYSEKLKIDPNYKLGDNIEGPGIKYILNKVNLFLFNKKVNNTLDKKTHNFVVPFITLLIFSYVAIRYFDNIKTRLIHLIIYSVLTYVLIYNVS
jgi:hypothetical protein